MKREITFDSVETFEQWVGEEESSPTDFVVIFRNGQLPIVVRDPAALRKLLSEEK